MKIYVMDAFAAKLFGGNQAGVALPEEDVSDETMRLIAAELKHSETAFVWPRADGSVEDLMLHVKGLTDDEKEIILDGCLMNYYAKRSN